MGCRTEELVSDCSISSSLGDALLFTTMCIIGLTVEVQVKDGSIYTGIFYTACVEKDYGIILKKARMTKKGKNGANVANGAVVDTLVVLSGDLVQVVAKGVLLPADGLLSLSDGDNVEPVVRSNQPISCQYDLERDQEALKPGKTASKRGNNEIDFEHQPRSLNQLEEKNSASDLKTTSFENGYLTESERVSGTRSAKPSELSQAVEKGKLDDVCKAKIGEASFVPVAADNGRQAGKGRPQGEDDAYSICKENTVGHAVLRSNSNSFPCILQQISTDGMPLERSSNNTPGATGVSPASSLAPQAPDFEKPFTTVLSASGVLTSSSSASVVDTSSSCPSSLSSPNGLAASKSSFCNTNTKEFKLNPGAKTFSPSFTNPQSAVPAVSTVATTTYVPSSTHVVPIASAHPGIEISPFVPRSPLPVKFVPYNNLVVRNNGSTSQYSLPLVGPVTSRQQQMRYGGQYQTGPPYVHPNHLNSQTVMVGPLGQAVFVQPISDDAIQGSAALPQGLVRPSLAPDQVHLPKHQGNAAPALQLCATRPFIASVQQPLAVPSHNPFSQPVPGIRPLVVPAVNGVFSHKFP